MHNTAGFLHSKINFAFRALCACRSRRRGELARRGYSHLQRSHCAGSCLVKREGAVCVCPEGRRRVADLAHKGVGTGNQPNHPPANFLTRFVPIRGATSVFNGSTQFLMPWTAFQSSPWPRGRRYRAPRWPSDYEGEKSTPREPCPVYLHRFCSGVFRWPCRIHLRHRPADPLGRALREGGRQLYFLLLYRLF